MSTYVVEATCYYFWYAGALIAAVVRSLHVLLLSEGVVAMHRSALNPAPSPQERCAGPLRQKHVTRSRTCCEWEQSVQLQSIFCP